MKCKKQESKGEKKELSYIRPSFLKKVFKTWYEVSHNLHTLIADFKVAYDSMCIFFYDQDWAGRSLDIGSKESLTNDPKWPEIKTTPHENGRMHNNINHYILGFSEDIVFLGINQEHIWETCLR